MARQLRTQYVDLG